MRLRAEHTFTSEFRRHGYWVAQVSDNPHLGFTKAYEPFRKSFSHWKSVVGQSGFYRSPETIPLSTVYHWLPEFLRDERYIPGMRKYLANTGGGVNEEETCAARVFKEARAHLKEARLRQPFCLTVDCFDPHEPWSPTPRLNVPRGYEQAPNRVEASLEQACMSTRSFAPATKVLGWSGSTASAGSFWAFWGCMPVGLPSLTKA